MNDDVIGRPLRVLMVTPRYLPEMGGIETHVAEVSRRLAADGVEVSILTTDRSHSLPSDEWQNGVYVRRVPAMPRRRDFYFAPGILTGVLRTPCDVVHVQGYHTFVAPMAMITALVRDLPFVVTFHSGGHSSQLRTMLRSPQHRLLAPLVRRAGHCIGVSRFEAEFFSTTMRIPLSRFSVIPNGAQMPALPPAETLATNDDGPTLVSIGRLERYKGHHRVIAAMPEIVRRLPAARLRILGEGPYKPALLDLVSQLGLGDRVEISGIPPERRAELAAVLGRAALVVLLSEYEAHPVAAMEALALGRRLLVTDSSGFREMVDHDVVEAVPLDASPELVAATAESQIAKGPLDRPIPLPSWEGCAASLAEVYRNVARPLQSPVA